ncbi:MAG: NnrS family protein [Acetobacteraceae bacterium]
MSVAVAGHVRARRPVFLSMGFRPFFLASAGWAAIALALWLAMLNGWLGLSSRFDPLAWHIHEMLFGFVLATVGGFLLTAIPNWTGRTPVAGGWLTLLLGLWALGRIVCLGSRLLPAWLATAADLAFVVALGMVAAKELLAARNWRNLPVVGPLGLFAVANLLMHLEAAGIAVPAGLGWRLGLIAALVLISAIGGRIVPAFTRNWLTLRGQPALPAVRNRVDRAALGFLHAGLLAWALFPGLGAVGYLLILAGALNFWRLARWCGAATLSEPLLLILHVGYAWLAVGAALLGFSMAGAFVPLSAAIHALTVGAIATMILAVMTRATRGHTGRALVADRPTVAIYLLITAAALARLAAAWTVVAAMPLLLVSGALWIGAFSLFAIVYGRMMVHSPLPAAPP